MTQIEQQIAALAAQGVSLKDAEAFIGRSFTPDEQVKFRRARTAAALRRKVEKAKGASGADRVAKHVATRNEVGEIPKVRHPRLKERCRFDLAAFAWYFCRELLNHRPSPDIVDALITPVQNYILHGGQVARLAGRGTGKSTLINQIAQLWAALYGHRRFPFTFGASLTASRDAFNTLKYLLETSDRLAADFPAVILPIRHLGGVSQRAAQQTYHGAKTGIVWGSSMVVFPTLRDAEGRPLDVACGAILGASGYGGAVRGKNVHGQRPDMVLIDDPQTRKIASSPKLVEAVIDFIHSDILALAGHNTTIAAFLTITPQRFGDVAMQIATSERFANWNRGVHPFIKRFCPNWDQLAALFCEEYARDAAQDDFDRKLSTAWYRENRHLFAGMETMDDEQFDHEREVDVVHHLLNLRAKLGEKSFNAEIQMKVVDSVSEITITPDTVAASMNGNDRCVLPPGTDTVVGFCDVNIQAGAGLSWALVAFGPKRTAAIVDYGRFPADGTPLVPPNASDLVRNRRVAAAIREVVTFLATRRLRDRKGRSVKIRALGFDRGWLPDVVHRTLFVVRKRIPLGFPIVAMRGFPWNKFGTRKEDILRRGDHVFATRSRFGEYLAFMAPYWREVMQSGFLETPLQEGSLSLFGKDAGAHFLFASEICAEKLVRKYQAYSGRETTTAWDWLTTGPEHFCDAVTGAFALASWFRAYDALSSTIDAAALGVTVPRQVHQDDLFDPRLNAAINDDTEGTGEELPQLAEDRDLNDDIDAHRLPDPVAAPKFRRMANGPARSGGPVRPVRPGFKFKKGKWKK